MEGAEEATKANLVLTPFLRLRSFSSPSLRRHQFDYHIANVIAPKALTQYLGTVADVQQQAV